MRDYESLDLSGGTVDARDLQRRLAYCESLRDDLVEAVDAAEADIRELEAAGDTEHEAATAELKKAQDELAEFEGGESEEGADYSMLKGIEDDIEAAVANGSCFIYSGHFTEYCKELCRDVGDLPDKLPWYIENHIDWEGVAEELKADYTCVSLDNDDWYYGN